MLVDDIDSAVKTVNARGVDIFLSEVVEFIDGPDAGSAPSTFATWSNHPANTVSPQHHVMEGPSVSPPASDPRPARLLARRSIGHATTHLREHDRARRR
jgi:hypothetical protein